MRLWLLKFNYGVEIGARLAYLGHYAVTGDENIADIAEDEFHHKVQLGFMLRRYGSKPSPIINWAFTMIGMAVQKACHYSPRFMLNAVARSLEVFAVFSYSLLAKLFPEQSAILMDMAETERRHEEYFKRQSTQPPS